MFSLGKIKLDICLRLILTSIKEMKANRFYNRAKYKCMLKAKQWKF